MKDYSNNLKIGYDFINYLWIKQHFIKEQQNITIKNKIKRISTFYIKETFKSTEPFYLNMIFCINSIVVYSVINISIFY